MDLNEIEQHVLAYYIAGAAKELTIAPRYFPHGELILVIADKIEVAVRRFGRKVMARSKPAAATFLDTMIEREAFSTTRNDFGGTMHRFQADHYRAVLKEMQDASPIIQKAAAQGDPFWSETFQALTH
jgi:hypothetical protein